uniref:uncharacterized protein LOC131134938 isoform X2 n=1 Tax=Doryrhamphus excisus TaxID=161450 RepID=UPI0025AE472F|nr:uncharacterized protein LOC131134938 isoform X2 [Doryrhamphus excisus]
MRRTRINIQSQKAAEHPSIFPFCLLLIGTCAAFKAKRMLGRKQVGLTEITRGPRRFAAAANMKKAMCRCERATIIMADLRGLLLPVGLQKTCDPSFHPSHLKVSFGVQTRRTCQRLIMKEGKVLILTASTDVSDAEGPAGRGGGARAHTKVGLCDDLWKIPGQRRAKTPAPAWRGSRRNVRGCRPDGRSKSSGVPCPNVLLR